MAKHLLLISLILVGALGLLNDGSLPTCPSGGVPAIAGSLTIHSGADIKLTSTSDIQCYNYTLAKAFDCPPSVAIGTTHFEASPSNNLFYSIKAINSDSNGVIPFIVRTHWGYTRWSKITFYFLAETSELFQAGYYQIDTATLSACISGKQIIAFIPTQCKSQQWKALTFLSGFQISSVSPKGTYFTPFEVQVVLKSVSTQGLTLLISTTSATQIHSLFVSYVAYDPSIKNLAAGEFLYSKYNGVNKHVGAQSLPVDTQLQFIGFNSFIVGNDGGNFGLTLNYGLKEQIAQSVSKFYYLSANSIHLFGGACGQCLGYSIPFEGKCVASCPPSSYFDGKTCVTCAAGQVWDGTKCTTPVKPDNNNNNNGNNNNNNNNNNGGSSVSISCPRGTYWDGQQLRCLPCPNGCSSCPDCYSCDTCSLGFYFKSGNPLCQQVCGDGKKFVLECDDGNTVSGDGCSSSCQVQANWLCTGGSPLSADNCSKGLPTALTIDSSGQSHVWGKVIVNIKLNYLPKALIDNAVDCRNGCNNILDVSIISGDNSATSIVAQYIPQSRYSFSVEVNFGREPIGMFVLRVALKSSIATKYYSGIDTSKVLNVNVNPAYFSQSNQGSNLV